MIFEVHKIGGSVKLAFLSIAFLFVGEVAMAKIIGKDVEYKSGADTFLGYVAYDDSLKQAQPGILVVHEWTGIGSYVKSRCEQLAKMGYIAFAPDIYGKGIRPAAGKEAGALAGKYKSDRKLLRERVKLGYDELNKFPLVNKEKLAAIGYCFGGTTILELARSGAKARGFVSFHGGLDSLNPADAKQIKGKVLVLHGADDPNVPPAQVEAFESEMRNAKVDWQLVKYGGAVHAFTNKEAGNDNSKGAAYNESADRRSWIEMEHFFSEIFK